MLVWTVTATAVAVLVGTYECCELVVQCCAKSTSRPTGRGVAIPAIAGIPTIIPVVLVCIVAILVGTTTSIASVSEVVET